MSVGHTVLAEAAIDLGFFSTKLTYGEGSNRSGSVILTDIFPSWAVRSSEFEAMGKSKQLGSMCHDGATVVVDGMPYFVGKSSLLATSSVGGLRIAHDNYSQSPQYKAIFLGALFYIAKHHKAGGSLTIERLCVGLPITTFFSHKDDLEKLAVGTHLIPNPIDQTQKLKVHIKQAIVIGQPQGAAMNFGLNLGEKLDKDRIVVLDMGGGTFDWFFLDCLHPNFNRSGAAQLGVLSCVHAICEQLDPKYKTAPLCVERINQALTEDASVLRLDGREHEMSSLWPAVQHVLHQAIGEMAKSVGNFVEVDRFLFTGGGASLLERAAKSKNSALAGEQRKFVIDKEPVFANVIGFHKCAQLVGVE